MALLYVERPEHLMRVLSSWASTSPSGRPLDLATAEDAR